MVKSLRKEKSGHEKILKKRKELALKESQRGALNRFLVKIAPIIVPHSTENKNVAPSLDHNEIENDPNLIDNDREEVPNIVVSENEEISDTEDDGRLGSDDVESEESFRTKFFLQIVDQAISSLERRCGDIFGFLFSSDTLNSMDDDHLKARCDNLEASLRHEEASDIDVNDLFAELKVLRKVLPREITTAVGIFNFLKRQDSFPITSIAYKVLLAIPVTVASAERSFSKLNILKSFLRTTMAQERLNGLAMISIEHGFFDDVDIDSLVDDFAAVNSRRLNFHR
ncbi:uncharacterized protein LOC113358959 [Papaver somniferum]|uniref:uncharacterized protein LOC113358959 n=1 Tax=Papaver somniferum TaxID=3469 RepID=UPI000E6FCA5E|nr:uncharacterized protein LOC113358959 [Papaver somniferum]